MRRTKIICTLGPSCDNEETIKGLIKNGMNCARFNFSHGDHQEQETRMNLLRKVCVDENVKVGVILDTKGPEIRLKDFKENSVILKKGQNFTLDGSKSLGDENRVAITFPSLYKYVKEGTKILIDDGKIGMEVISISKNKITCKVLNGGKISNHKSINVPKCKIEMPYINEIDKSDILFGIKLDVDYIAASFVRSADDVKQLRQLLDNNGGNKIKIISKIENSQGLENLQEIIKLSDGIMVARGDLGVEIPFKEVPSIQKNMIKQCLDSGKIVVTATQMLESMTHNPRPTRAEVSDVANAIYDGSTAIMLSGETANGEYPLIAVKTMSDIAKYTEMYIDYSSFIDWRKTTMEKNKCNAICITACNAAAYLNAKAIVVLTKSGKTAALLSNFKPICPIIALTVDKKGLRQLNLAWGVKPIQAELQENTDGLFKYAYDLVVERKLAQKGDNVIFVAGINESLSADMLRIITI